MKPEPNEPMTTMTEHRRNSMSARDIQDEIRLIRLAYRERQETEHKRDLRFIALFVITMMISALCTIIYLSI